MEVNQAMNLIPVITLFGGLTAFFTLAVTLSFALGKSQAVETQNDNHIAGS